MNMSLSNTEVIRQLRGELVETRARLAEAEEALNAIRNGEVDGLVMAGTEGQQVFTLTGAQEPYRLLIEQMSEGALTLSTEGLILYANHTLARLLQTPLERVIGAEFRSFVVPEDQSTLADLMAAAQSATTRGVVSVTAADGSSVPLRLGLSQLMLGSERLISIVATDLTVVRQKEEQLHAIQLYTRSLIEANLDPMVVIGNDGKIADVNDAATTITGFGRENLIGSKFQSHFRDPPRAAAGYQQTLTDGFIRDYPLELLHTDGHSTPVLCNAAFYLNDSGKVAGVMATAHDNTERAQFEQALQAKNLDLEKALSARDRFLGSMSHELRTPLNAILGFTGMLLMKLPGPLTGDQEHQLSTVQTSARHLLALINDLLDLAKIDSGKVEIEYEPIVCQIVIEEVAAALKPLADRKGLALSVKAPKTSVRVNSNLRILKQILINLTDNAIKFTNTGRVRIELGTRGSNEDTLAMIDVIDTGIGIRLEDKEKLFQAFQQVDVDHRQDGTGLGLYLSQKLAVLLNGRIELESEFGQGSNFRLLIPQNEISSRPEPSRGHE